MHMHAQPLDGLLTLRRRDQRARMGTASTIQRWKAVARAVAIGPRLWKSGFIEDTTVPAATGLYADTAEERSGVIVRGPGYIQIKLYRLTEAGVVRDCENGS